YISTADGDDSVAFDASDLAGPLDLRIDTGQGADAVETALNLTGVLYQGETWAWVNAVFNLGDSADTLQLDCNSGAMNTNLQLIADAGRGQDVVQVNIDVQDAGVVMPCDVVGNVAIRLGEDDD